MAASGGDPFDRIRSKLASGELPAHTRSRVFVVHGQQRPCACCDRAIGASESQYEFEIDQELPLTGIVMHVQCYLHWFAAVRSIELSQRLAARPSAFEMRSGIPTWRGSAPGDAELS